MSGPRRWALALIGACVVTGLVVLLFIIGAVIGEGLMREACPDRGGVWNEQQSVCEGYEP